MANKFVQDHPLRKRSKDSAAMLPYWDKVDAIVNGHEAVRDAGPVFLPKFANEETSDYTTRLSMTKFTNIYRDVLEGLASKPFQEEVTLLASENNPVPEEFMTFTENVDGSGNNLTVFAANTFFNGINSAIDWIFVDYPNTDTASPVSVADAKRLKIKPFWTQVLGRNVLEVRSEIIGSEEYIVYFRMLEPSNNDDPDCVRIFTKIGDTVGWELYRENPRAEKEQDAMILIGSGTLSIPIIPMVPFITGRREGKSYKIHPTLKDAADLQITLYQDESALQFIKTMACYPMLAANGIKPQTEPDGKTPLKIAVGPMKILYSPPSGDGSHGEWKYVEPNANSMEFLKKSIDSTKQDLRELGRQPLTALASQLTTVTTTIAAGKAKSAVGAWALILKDALENAYKITGMYLKNDYEVEVNVYQDFDNVLDSNADVDNLITARENGDLSRRTLLSEMKRRKILSPEFNYENEMTEILTEIPSETGDDIEPVPGAKKPSKTKQPSKPAA